MADAPTRRPIVVTGAGGFVGRRLIRRLHAQGDAVIGVGRNDQPADWPEGARWVRADLLDPKHYEPALAGAACVIHLAAVTGKASAEEFRRVNVDATQELLGACVHAGVSRFIFVSSIAAKFADRRYYPYAESKIEAEACVRAAPIASVIVRPTMILGAGSPIEQSLARLAMLPVSPIFGDARRLVQPIDVDDVADVLTKLAAGIEPHDELIELGGPDQFDLRELYARLRAARGGKGAPRFAQLPLGLSRWGLALIEKPLLRLLPLTAGQLASFANDGVASPRGQALLPNPRPAPQKVIGIGQTPADAELAKEFARHARYLAGVTPTPYQTAKYLDFHARRRLAPRDATDALLLGLSRLGGGGLALADSYSGLLYRSCVVRAKLVLGLAILEASPPSFTNIDAPDPGFAILRVATRGALAGLSFLIAALIIAPFHLVLGLAGRLSPSR